MEVLGVTQWNANKPRCEICNYSFNCLYNRPHHCRLCGRCVCHWCSGQQIPIQDRLERACKPCHEKYIKSITRLLSTPSSAMTTTDTAMTTAMAATTATATATATSTVIAIPTPTAINNDSHDNDNDTHIESPTRTLR
eukprot:TRINITY_DN2259_c0_g1_i4.p2 TRINITY_DN2259_c0_g1~~TRINITY_DN2259_c0_g1_i4.p2  ORF type:complete len:138 (+),score=12.38 TRINITY_DN2259_c0_g1_i4:265-678(+)